MVHKLKKLELATYYRERGFSYSEISSLVGVSKSTLSNWFSKKKISQKITKDNQVKANKDNRKRIMLLNKAKAKEMSKNKELLIKSAVVEYTNYKTHPHFVAGLCTYFSNGLYKSNIIHVVHTRMEIHKILIPFFVRYLGVDKSELRFWLALNHKHDLDTCVSKWSRYLGISKSQFYKTQVDKNVRKKEILHFGVGHLIIKNTLLKYKLDTWTKLVVQDFST